MTVRILGILKDPVSISRAIPKPNIALRDAKAQEQPGSILLFSFEFHRQSYYRAHAGLGAAH